METTQTIAGREYRIGATYAAKHGGAPRVLRVAWERLKEVEWSYIGGQWKICSYRAWARWAGEEVSP